MPDMNKVPIAEMVEVGNRLREAREKQGLEAQEVAARVGVAASAYGYWEKGLQEGGCIKVTNTGKALGLTPNQLYGVEVVIAGASAPMTLAEIATTLQKMDALCADADTLPSKIFADHLKGLFAAMESVVDEDTVKEIQSKIIAPKGAPPIRVKAITPHKRRGASGEAVAESAGEAAGAYGKRKKK